MKFLFLFLLCSVPLFAQAGKTTGKIENGTLESDVLLWEADSTKWYSLSQSAFKDTFGFIMSTIEAGVVLNDTTVGTANVTAINTAITTLNTAGGGTLFFWGGIDDTLTINNPINIKSNVHWVGLPTIWLKSQSDTEMVVAVHLTNVTIIDLTFDGNEINQFGLTDNFPPKNRYIFSIDSTVSDVIWDNVTFKNAGYRAISMRNEGTGTAVYSDITIRNCKFIDMGAAAIEVRSSDNIVIHDNYFKNWSKYSQTTLYTSNVWVIDHPAIQLDGATAWGNSHNLVVTNNVAVSNDSATDGSNFFLEGGGTSLYAKVTGNHLTGNNTGTSGRWSHSTFNNNRGFNTVVSGNNPWATGLEIYGDHNMMDGNDFFNGAIYFGAISGPSDFNPTRRFGSHNTAINNVLYIDDTNTGNIYGISLGGTGTADADTFGVHNVIRGNVVTNNSSGSSGGGISVGQNAWGYNNVRVSNNDVLRDTSLSAINTGIRVFLLDGSRDISLTENTVFGYGTGIQMDTLTQSDTYSDIYFLRNIFNENTTALSNESLIPIIKDNVGNTAISTITIDNEALGVDTLTLASYTFIDVRNTVNASDSIHAIIGGVAKESYQFQAVHTDTTIIFIDGGNLKLGGTRTLDSDNDILILWYDGTNFIETSFINND